MNRCQECGKDVEEVLSDMGGGHIPEGTRRLMCTECVETIVMGNKPPYRAEERPTVETIVMGPEKPPYDRYDRNLPAVDSFSGEELDAPEDEQPDEVNIRFLVQAFHSVPQDKWPKNMLSMGRVALRKWADQYFETLSKDEIINAVNHLDPTDDSQADCIEVYDQEEYTPLLESEQWFNYMNDPSGSDHIPDDAEVEARVIEQEESENGKGVMKQMSMEEAICTAVKCIITGIPCTIEQVSPDLYEFWKFGDKPEEI